MLCLALLHLPAEAAWLRAETENVILMGNVDEPVLRAFGRKIERFHALLEGYFGKPPSTVKAPKLPVYLVRNETEFRKAMPGVRRNVAGKYVARADGIVAIAWVGRQGRGHLNYVLFHEYAHHFMFQRSNGAYPAWFIEGFAEYFSPSSVG